MSKLKGLVIPEVTEGTSPGERSSLTSRHKSSTIGSKSTSSSGTSSLPSPPWKEKESGQQAEFPKYSPAFKRKPFTVYNTKKASEKDEKDESSPQSKPPIGKRNSDDNLPTSCPVTNNLPTSCTVTKTEDSDNDPAVSS